MNLKKKDIFIIYRIIFFIPILIYLGERSLIAFDEGFYALQAKWILNSNDWLAPIVSPLILSTTFVWINYVNLATQDIVFSSIVTFGIFSCIKYFKTEKNIFLFFIGIWIGLAFMLKTYLALIPTLALIPFLISYRIFNKKLFWIGLAIGFMPFLIWSFKIISIYGFNDYSGLFNKLISLSNNNTFTNPFYYYLWNIPLNIFPWSILAIIGFITSFKYRNSFDRYFLFFYPLILVFLLSCFSTKTPYYYLQILSLISLNAYIGLSEVIKKKKLFFNKIKFLNFYLIPIILIFSMIYINIETSIFKIDSDQKFILSLALFVFSISWISLGFTKSRRKKLILSILGPYLMTTLIVQSGTLNDRTKELRIASNFLVEQQALKDKTVEVITGGKRGSNAQSKIIKISLLMPKIGNGLNNINKLKINQYAWTTNSSSKISENDSYKVIDESEIFKPWILIIRQK